MLRMKLESTNIPKITISAMLSKSIVKFRQGSVACVKMLSGDETTSVELSGDFSEIFKMLVGLVDNLNLLNIQDSILREKGELDAETED